MIKRFGVSVIQNFKKDTKEVFYITLENLEFIMLNTIKKRTL